MQPAVAISPPPQVLRQVAAPHRCLFVSPGKTAWAIRDSIDASGAAIQSASAGAMCPAAPSNAVSLRFGVRRWRYYDGKEWIEGDIRLVCETHSH